MIEMRKTQVAMEFVILIAVLFVVMLLFLSFARNYVVDVQSGKDREVLKDISYAIQTEIHIAIGADNGYEREFIVPVVIDNLNYTINITGQMLWATTENDEFVLNIPSVVGQLKKGGNTIRKMDGTVYLNTGSANDTGDPVVTLVSPPDHSTDVDGNILFIYTVEDAESGIDSCILVFDGIANQTDNSITEGLSQIFGIDGASSGLHNWTVNCTDNSGNNNSAMAVARDITVSLVYNDPPSAPTSILCDGGGCNASFSGMVNVTCGGSVDPENDTVVYYVDAYYAPDNYLFEQIEAESPSFSYTGGYGATSSCICSGTSGTCIRDSTYSPGTWASATYASGYNTTFGRAFVYYCSENDGDDSHRVYEDADLKEAWTTSYESNNWEYTLVNNLSLTYNQILNLSCSRGTSSSYCRIDYVILDNRSWRSLGTHGNGSAIQWNISGYPDQNYVGLRCKAIDPNGSNVYTSMFDPFYNMQISASGGQSGSTINPDFTTDANGWTGADWNYGAWEVNPSEYYSSSGGNPDGSVRIYFGSGRNDEVGGYWRQGFDVPVNNPSSAICGFDWKVSQYDATPNTYQVYVFLDSGSGEPTIGQEIWSSGEITGTTSWSNESVDCTSKLGAAGTYYYKLAVWVETNGWPNDGPYRVDFDNAKAEWYE
ncbi:MAG: hypothetical protein ACE5DM_02115 [Candidatus Nanoarchaeia archaeon]